MLHWNDFYKEMIEIFWIICNIGLIYDVCRIGFYNKKCMKFGISLDIWDDIRMREIGMGLGEFE